MWCKHVLYIQGITKTDIAVDSSVVVLISSIKVDHENICTTFMYLHTQK